MVRILGEETRRVFVEEVLIIGVEGRELELLRDIVKEMIC